MIKADVLHPSALDAADRAAWRAWCGADPAFANPLLGPEFAGAVGDLRTDARVAVLSRAGEKVGFLAFHGRRGATARPIGSPFSDYHALIAAPGQVVDGAQALAAIGVSALRYRALVDPGGAFGGKACQDEGYAIALGAGGAEGYLEDLQQADPKRFKNWRRLTNKLEREAGPVRIAGPDHDQTAFDLLIRWKREQLRRTGRHDFLAVDWAARLMQSLFERREGEMQGLMVTLRAGDRVIAGHFGVVAGGHYHSWIASMDPDAGAWSPGQTLLFQAIAAMPRMGLKTYDLASSHAHYKAPFCNLRVPVFEGTALAATPAGRRQAYAEQAWALATRIVPPAISLRRRLDHIAAVELSAAAKAYAVIDAFASRARRRTADALS